MIPGGKIIIFFPWTDDSQNTSLEKNTPGPTNLKTKNKPTNKTQKCRWRDFRQQREGMSWTTRARLEQKTFQLHDVVLHNHRDGYHCHPTSPDNFLLLWHGLSRLFWVSPLPVSVCFSPGEVLWRKVLLYSGFSSQTISSSTSLHAGTSCFMFA